MLILKFRFVKVPCASREVKLPSQFVNEANDDVLLGHRGRGSRFEESCWFATSEVPQVKTLSHTGETEERGGPLFLGRWQD